MKKLIFFYLFPLIISLYFTYLFAINPFVNKILFGIKPYIPMTNPYFNYIPNYDEKIEYEKQFLSSNDTSESIFLLGSSELTNNTSGIPYNFISNHFTTKIKAVGHAGNQCFSIYSQLLANFEKLKNAPIVILLSPSWFEHKYATGTSSQAFLEYNSERYIKNIYLNNSDESFKDYESYRISLLNSDFINPSLPLKLLNFKKDTSKNFFLSLYYRPIDEVQKILMRIKLHIVVPDYKTPSLKIPDSRKEITSDLLNINWDSLENVSNKETLAKATNNNWGINNIYYTKYIKGRTYYIEPVIEPVDSENNQEYKDFIMLLKLLKEGNANASFIIMPLNPYFYTNLKELTPTINSLQNELNIYHYKSLNLWVDDSTKYDKGLLVDVMHLSDFAWYKVDKFIVDNYHLNK
jgi:D-alanyl-lipoteichoic acid biosynthesis protein DltD